MHHIGKEVSHPSQVSQGIPSPKANRDQQSGRKHHRKKDRFTVDEFRKLFGCDSERDDENRTEEPVDVNTINPTELQPKTKGTEK